MKRFLPKVLAAALAGASMVALSACGTATPYQPFTTSGPSTGGYAEYQISRDRFRVTFQGNTLTQRETVERYLLFRAAELTAQQGYDWFTMADRDTERQTRLYSVPRTETAYAWQPMWFRQSNGQWVAVPTLQPYFYNSYSTEQSTRYMASAEIFLGRGPAPANDPSVFDAREVIANLGPGIVRPEARG